MAGSQEEQWANNPNAPKIPYDLYLQEKAYFAGLLVASLLYGFVVVLFCQCMAGLFNPANHRRERVKWGLVCYTGLVFAVATVITGTGLNLGSISFVDNRDYPGSGDEIAPGPIGYQISIYQTALSLVPSLMFFLNYWLADGLLLYRCYVIYSRNRWVVALPFLMYLGSLATGVIILTSQAHGWNGSWAITLHDASIPCISISVSLNILLTLLIVIRLLLHGRNVRAAAGPMAGISGLYKTVATMLIESSALYAVNSLLVIGLWAANSNAATAFPPILAEAQVIAPLLIIQRIADQSALTSNTIVTGNASTFHARSRGGLTSDNISGEHPMDSPNKYGRSSGELGAGVGVEVETTIDFRRDSKV